MRPIDPQQLSFCQFNADADGMFRLFDQLHFHHIGMGGSQSLKNSQEHPLRSSHPRLQAARLASLNGQRLIKLSLPLLQKDYDQWSEQLFAFQKSTSKLMLPVKHVFLPAGACGELGTVQAYYPAFPYLLSDEIHDRRGKRRPFSEQELWYLLFSLAKAEHQNHGVLGVVGSLSPTNVFLNEEGSIRVPNALSWPRPACKIDKRLDEAPAYLSPEEVRTMQELTQEVSQLEEAGEMFSLGLTVLSAGNLADYLLLYDMQKASFNDAKFQEALREWSNKTNYSEVLRGVVVNLCLLDPTKRMTASQLWSLLSKHEENIAKKNNFLIDNATDKLHEGVQEMRRICGQQHPKAEQLRQRAVEEYFQKRRG